MSTQESLGLSERFELTHPSLPHSGRLVRLFSPIVIILLSTVDRIGHDLTLSYRIASQLIRHDLPWLSAIGSHQPPEEALCCCAITLGL